MKLSEKLIERSRLLLKNRESFLAFLNKPCPENDSLRDLYYKAHDEMQGNIHELYFGKNFRLIRFFDSSQPLENPDNDDSIFNAGS